MTSKEFENGGFTLKTHQIFSVHTTLEEFKTATITGHVRFVFGKKYRSGKSHELLLLYRFRKNSVFNSRPHENEKPVRSNSSGLQSVFEELRFHELSFSCFRFY